MSMRLQKRKQRGVHFVPINLSALWNVDFLFGTAYLGPTMFSKYHLPSYDYVNPASWNYIDYCRAYLNLRLKCSIKRGS